MKTLRDPTMEIPKSKRVRKRIKSLQGWQAKRRELARDSPSRRGYGRRWRKLRELILAREPLCRACSTVERPVAASEVDHIVPHRCSPALLHDPHNLQPLCASCHAKKTSRGL